MKSLYLLGGVLLIFLGLISKSLAGQADWERELRAVLESTKYPEPIDRENFKKNEHAYVREMTRAFELKDRCAAILAIWLFTGDSDSLELAWWRSKDPATRALIVAVYSAMRSEPISGIPSFERYAGQFSDQEKQNRLSEIRWAEEAVTRKAIAKDIYNWARRNLASLDRDELAARKLAAYQRMAENPSLPTVHE